MWLIVKFCGNMVNLLVLMEKLVRLIMGFFGNVRLFGNSVMLFRLLVRLMVIGVWLGMVRLVGNKVKDDVDRLKVVLNGLGIVFGLL